jgi:hypothetical protein
MNLELSGEETEALLKELNDIIDGDRYQFSARVRMLKADPRQDQVGAGARAVTASSEAICPTAGDRGKETAALTGRLCHSLCGRVRMKMITNSEPIAVRLQKTCDIAFVLGELHRDSRYAAPTTYSGSGP